MALNFGKRLILALSVLQLLWCLAFAGVAHADAELPRFIDSISAETVFPGADRLGAVTTDPVVAPAYRQGEQLGFVDRKSVV